MCSTQLIFQQYNTPMMELELDHPWHKNEARQDNSSHQSKS